MRVLLSHQKCLIRGTHSSIKWSRSIKRCLSICTIDHLFFFFFFWAHSKRSSSWSLKCPVLFRYNTDLSWKKWTDYLYFGSLSVNCNSPRLVARARSRQLKRQSMKWRTTTTVRNYNNYDNNYVQLWNICMPVRSTGWHERSRRDLWYLGKCATRRRWKNGWRF